MIAVTLEFDHEEIADSMSSIPGVADRDLFVGSIGALFALQPVMLDVVSGFQDLNTSESGEQVYQQHLPSEELEDTHKKQ